MTDNISKYQSWTFLVVRLELRDMAKKNLSLFFHNRSNFKKFFFHAFFYKKKKKKERKIQMTKATFWIIFFISIIPSVRIRVRLQEFLFHYQNIDLIFYQKMVLKLRDKFEREKLNEDLTWAAQFMWFFFGIDSCLHNCFKVLLLIITC